MSYRDDRAIVGQCGACGKDLHAAGEASWQGADYALIPLGPGATALCCATGLGHAGQPSRLVKGSCARRIRQRRNLCPGCAKPSSCLNVSRDMTWLGVLCEDCNNRLARSRLADEQAVRLHQVHSSKLFPFLKEPLEAAQHLAHAVAGTRRRWVDATDEIRFGEKPWARERVPSFSGGSSLAADPVVELSAEQAESLDALAVLLAEAFEAERQRGFAEGNDLLQRLARGEVLPSDYERWSPKRNPR